MSDHLPHLPPENPSRDGERNVAAETATLPEELEEIHALITALPEPFQPAFLEAVERSAAALRQRRRILEYIQETLGQLRVDMKYVVFDLEATRRERDEYRRLLEESH